MNISIPLWLWLTGAIAVVLVTATVIGLTVFIGVTDSSQVLNITLWKPYPIPRDARAAQPRQNQP